MRTGRMALLALPFVLALSAAVSAPVPARAAPPAPGALPSAAASAEPSPSPTGLSAMDFLALPAHDLERAEREPQPAVRMGDTLVLRVAGLDAGADPRIEAAPGSASLDDQGWEILPANAPAGELRFRAVPLRAGRLTLPSLSVSRAGPEGARAAFARTNPFVVEVQPAVKPEDPKANEAADPTPPVRIGFPWWLAAAALVALAILAAAGILLYRRYVSKRGVKVPARPAEPPRPEDEVALAALAELERAGPLRRGEFKAHYFRVSEIVKTYLGARYGFDAVESTTGEMIRALERRGAMGDQQLDRLESMFGRLDLVKFTDHVPLPDEGAHLLELARELVKATRRAPSIAPAAAGKGGAP